MADIFVKTFTRGPDPDWQDGDVLCAISDRRRMARLARVAWRPGCLTGPGLMTRTYEGEYKGGGLHEEIHRLFYEASCRVVSATEYEITYPGHDPYLVGPPRIQDLETKKWTDIDLAVNPITGKEEHVWLDRWLANRRRSGKKLFRDPDSGEIRWYSGRELLPSRKDLDALWIKLAIGHGWQPGGHSCPALWPIGVQESKSHLCLHVDDFDETDEAEWTTPETEEQGAGEDIETVTIKRRRHSVEWRELSGMSSKYIEDILDMAKPVDGRTDGTTLEVEDPYICATVVETKPAAIAVER